MREERLLERIKRWEKEPHARSKEDPKRVVDSVVRHLQQLLNTRQGSVQIADDYGIPDFTHFMHAGVETTTVLESAIKEIIRKYEPRLTNVVVRFTALDEERLSLGFQILGKLTTGNSDVLFETIVGSDGRVQVKG